MFGKLLGVRFREEKVSTTEYTTDGNLEVTTMPAAIRECKNHSGNGLNQVIIYYARFLQEALDRRFYNFKTCFPCILIVDMGMSTL